MKLEAVASSCAPVSYTHLDVYKRQMNTLVIVLIAAVCLFGAYVLYGLSLIHI